MTLKFEEKRITIGRVGRSVPQHLRVVGKRSLYLRKLRLLDQACVCSTAHLSSTEVGIAEHMIPGLGEASNPSKIADTWEGPHHSNRTGFPRVISMTVVGGNLL